MHFQLKYTFEKYHAPHYQMGTNNTCNKNHWNMKRSIKWFIVSALLHNQIVNKRSFSTWQVICLSKENHKMIVALYLKYNKQLKA
jgi:hypothetical protein